MAPTITTQNHTLVSNAEVSFGTITNPAGFDFVDAFVDGSGNPDANEAIAEWRLYEIVSGLPVLVATAPGGGSTPSVLNWQVGGSGIPFRTPSPAPFSPAEGAGFTFELRAFFDGGRSFPPNFTASLIGYDEFDVAPNTVAPAVAVTLPTNFTEVTIATVPGYAQFADAVVSQSFDVPVRFTLYAQAGPGGVIAEVAGVTLQSSDGIARIFGSPLRLPGATAYILRARFDSNLLQRAPNGPVVISAGLATHSKNISVGGVVTLTGNDNGPSNANRFLSLPVPANNADVVIPEVGPVSGDGWWDVPITGLTALHQVLLPANPSPGEVVTVTDVDGSLAGQTFNVNGNGHNVEGVPVYSMNATYPGPFGSICLMFVASPLGGGEWVIFAAYDKNATTGGAVFTSNTLVGNDADIPAAAFVTHGWWFVRMINLTANRTVNLPAAPNNGDVVVVKSGANGLETGNQIIVNGGANTIDGAPTDTLTIASPGQNGSRSYYFDTTVPNPGWFAF